MRKGVDRLASVVGEAIADQAAAMKRAYGFSTSAFGPASSSHAFTVIASML
jgi:hypothetical protein